MISEIFLNLVRQLQQLPGVGEKTATRMAFSLIKSQKSIELADAITDALTKLKNCSKCNMISDFDTCEICNNPNRNNNLLCIVKTSQDVILFEKSQQYKGKYFVLGNLLSPIDGIGPDEINIPKLIELVEETKPNEIIIALSPSTEGEATIHYIYQIFKNHNIKITRLSTGIPLGGNINYLNQLTLQNAFVNRHEV